MNDMANTALSNYLSSHLCDPSKLKILTIIRGLPGSGKTTAAKDILKMRGQVDPLAMYAADDFFYKDKNYKFDPEKLSEAHKWCQSRTVEAMKQDTGNIVVHKTFTVHKEMRFYLDKAIEHNYCIEVFNLYDAGLTDEELFERNVHSVPLETIKRMRRRYEKTGEYQFYSPWEYKAKESENEQ